MKTVTAKTATAGILDIVAILKIQSYSKVQRVTSASDFYILPGTILTIKLENDQTYQPTFLLL